jgi:serine/threonine protein kinase
VQVIEHGGGILHRIKDGRSRAVLEAHITHQLVHPNIVTSFGYFSGVVTASKLMLPSRSRDVKVDPHATRDVTLHFQEYCALGSLRAALDKGTLGNPDAGAGGEGGGLVYFKAVAHIAAQVAAGVAYAHSCGVLHCDLKSENVLLQRLAADQRFEGVLHPACMSRCEVVARLCHAVQFRVMLKLPPRARQVHRRCVCCRRI